MGIGFSSIAAGFAVGPVRWLTNTPEVEEADASIARWQPQEGTGEEYLVGWSEDCASHKLARLDAEGTLLEGPVGVSEQVRWGRRDGPFRQHLNRDVVWGWFDAAGSTTLRVARVVSGATASGAAF